VFTFRLQIKLKVLYYFCSSFSDIFRLKQRKLFYSGVVLCLVLAIKRELEMRPVLQLAVRVYIRRVG